MQTSRKDNFKELTAEDIAAELLPLVREYFVGECRQEGGNLQVNGMVSDTDVFIRADSVRYTPEQIWDHETYHITADRDPAIVRQTAARPCSRSLSRTDPTLSCSTS